MILVTGATGLVGRAVVCRLASLGHDVVAMVRVAQPQAGACHLESRCAYAMQLCKQDLESPQIESGDIVSGLTAGHQIGNQFPSHGR
jgi:nucleoside-diphosphate-sugar epimerase